MNLRYFERRAEVVQAYVRAENGCEETNHFVKPSAVGKDFAGGILTNRKPEYSYDEQERFR